MLVFKRFIRLLWCLLPTIVCYGYVKYDILNSADFSLKIDRSIYDGPGSHLLFQTFVGTTITRDVFRTQFVLDLQKAIGVDPSRLYLLNITQGTLHYSWLAKSVIVTFRIFERNDTTSATVLELSNNLTALCQDFPDGNSSSITNKLYGGKVTDKTDPLWGLVTLNWDISLKLMISIDVVGGDSVVDDYYINEGGTGICYHVDHYYTDYCEFDRLFSQDIARTLNISTSRIQVLFVKKSSMDSVIVTFRLKPSQLAESKSVIVLVNQLSAQMHDLDSVLYSGNFTVRVDRTYGVSGSGGRPRISETLDPNIGGSNSTTTNATNINYLQHPIFDGLNYVENLACRLTHRCNNGLQIFNQSSNTVSFYQILFHQGSLFDVSLYYNFENWKVGTLGWQFLIGTNSTDKKSIEGAHFQPDSFTGLGPNIPNYMFDENIGLVLVKDKFDTDVSKQTDLVEELRGRTTWINENIETAVLDAERRARKDVRAAMVVELESYQNWLGNELDELKLLNSSQCALFPAENCSIVFNTSSLELYGVINGVGEIGIIGDDENEVEVAVFAFESIYLGPEVKVTVIGQRALVLTSKTTAIVNTTINVVPGTLGGFPGGYSVSRSANQSLTEPDDIPICSLSDYCRNGSGIAHYHSSQIISNNVNGPGSANLRVYLFVITTTADDIDEIQTVTISAKPGETLGGTFILKYLHYSTPPIPFNATAGQVRNYIEHNLNMEIPSSAINERRRNAVAGVGRVTVKRSVINEQSGYTWTITFTSVIGNVHQLKSSNYLTGHDSRVDIVTIRDGNQIGGGFKINFADKSTRLLAYNVTADAMASAILRDIPEIETVDIDRTDPTENCDDGLCENGPYQAKGFRWTLTIATHVGNVEYPSPTSPLRLESGVVEFPSCESFLTGSGIIITLVPDHSLAQNEIKTRVNVSVPFSLAYGGSGGSNGGEGGRGYSSRSTRSTYNDEKLTQLLGGSGGAMSLQEPFLINAINPPIGRGGHGGGAIEIVAANDVAIGTKGKLIVDGGPGEPTSEGGAGGGSGGSILLASGGTILIEGIVSARGGSGGYAHIPGLSGGGGGGGRVALYAQSISLRSSPNVDGGPCGDANSTHIEGVCTNNGHVGTLYAESKFRSLFYVDQTTGAQGTSSSLLVESHELLNTTSFQEKETPFSMNGPEYEFKESRPDRVTFYAKLGAMGEDSKKAGWGAIVALISTEDSIDTGDSIAVIGVMIGESMVHGSNFNMLPEEKSSQRHLQRFYPTVELQTWYKLDILINWDILQYDILVDDVLVEKQQDFIASSVNRIGLYTYHSSRAWFDEIFIGQENLMNFRCPEIESRGNLIDRPLQHGWGAEWVVGQTLTHETQRHESHILKRETYKFKDGGLIPMDGDGHRKFTYDIKFKSKDGDHPATYGDVFAGVLLRMPSETQSRSISFMSATKVTEEGLWTKGKFATKGIGSKYYWYGEHDNPKAESAPYFRGGVGVCSTDDFISWKFEGIAFHYSNLTDMVLGSNGPFKAERPKVLFNSKSNKFIMWMNVDNKNQSLGMAGVAVSDYPEGPFTLVRTFYPDGNETRDQTVYQYGDGSAFLARTYYNDVEYVMPEAIMQPMWDSVKSPDGNVNYGLSFHRANYHQAYDDYHDVFFQRWRGEDKPWQVECVNRVTLETRIVQYGELNEFGEVCNDPIEYKVVVGQGYQTEAVGVPSKFQDPDDEDNNYWSPGSVPAVRAQKWKYNYRDGSCGITILNSDIDEFDAVLEENYEPISRENCSNVVDNKLHPTPADKLIGVQRVVETRRAKYVAISRLSNDFMDTTGIVNSFEGELEGNYDLVTILASYGQWDWAAGTELGSTYRGAEYSIYQTESDFATRFHQYEKGENDRARYSLACVLDGQCPVNFADQIN